MTSVNARRKAYGLTFLISGLVLGGVGIFALWVPELWNNTLLKALLTILVLSGLSAVLFLLTFANDEDKVPQRMSVIIGLCSVLLAGLVVGEIWFALLEDVVMGKIAFTLLIVAGLAGFVMSVWEDFFERRRLKEEGYLD